MQGDLVLQHMGVWSDWCDKDILISSFELLPYFRNDKYVEIETFHVTVFQLNKTINYEEVDKIIKEEYGYVR